MNNKARYMNITLKSEHASVVRSHIHSGDFNTPDEVIEEALLCLQQRYKLKLAVLRCIPKIQVALEAKEFIDSAREVAALEQYMRAINLDRPQKTKKQKP